MSEDRLAAADIVDALNQLNETLALMRDEVVTALHQIRDAKARVTLVLAEEETR